MDPDFERIAAYHDRVAPEYDSRLTSNPHDILARRAFQALVTRHVDAGSTLLDFGCGTGIDALHFAENGYRVTAYDTSPGMIQQMELRCGSKIAAGEITSCCASYRDFLDGRMSLPRASAVTADFAVLNSIRDLTPLFNRFSQILEPPGWIILSILNPMHWLRLKQAKWWRDTWNRAEAQEVYFGDRPFSTYLHPESHLLRAARGFRLVGRANAGNLVRYDPQASRGGSVWWEPEGLTVGQFDRLLWRTPVFRLLGHFVFLVLRRDP
jgi:ubiquinone/menaquinone biosynthesis C-methylase UbiE